MAAELIIAHHNDAVTIFATTNPDCEADATRGNTQHSTNSQQHEGAQHTKGLERGWTC